MKGHIYFIYLYVYSDSDMDCLKDTYAFSGSETDMATIVELWCSSWIISVYVIFFHIS